MSGSGWSYARDLGGRALRPTWGEQTHGTPQRARNETMMYRQTVLESLILATYSSIPPVSPCAACTLYSPQLAAVLRARQQLLQEYKDLLMSAMMCAVKPYCLHGSDPDRSSLYLLDKLWGLRSLLQGSSICREHGACSFCFAIVRTAFKATSQADCCSYCQYCTVH